MADEMGSQELEPTRDESEEVESSYKIIPYAGHSLPFEFRNSIIAPFLNSLRYGNDLYKLIDKDAYFTNYGKYIDIILLRPNMRVKIAMLKDKTVLGWSLVENKTLHYIWVKKEVRRQGIGRSLLPKEFDTISHITNKAIGIWVNHYPEVRFNPFA